MDTDQRDTQAVESYLGYAKDTALITIAQLIVVLLHVLRIPLLTKALGTELYGDWSIIWATTVLITALATLYLNVALVRFLASEKNISRIRQGFLSATIIVVASGLLCSLVLILCSNFIAASFLGDKNMSQLVRFSSVMILTQALCQMGIAFFQAFRQIRWYAGLIITKAVTELGLMAIFLFFGWEITGLVIAVLASDVLCFATAFFIALRRTGIELPRFSYMGIYLQYGLPLVLSHVLLWIVQSSNRYIIAYYLQARDVGIFAAAYALSLIIMLLLGPLQVILLPAVSKSYDDGNMNMTSTYLRYSLKYLLALSIPAAFGLSVLSSPLLNIFTTTEFSTGSTVVPFVAVGLLFYNLYQVHQHIFFLVKKTYLGLIILCIAAALNIFLNIMLVPIMGILGAAVGTLVAFFVLGMLALFLSLKYIKFDHETSFIIKSLFSAAVMAAAILLINPSGLVSVVITILAGITIYSMLMLVLKGFNKAEINLLKELIRNSLSRGR